jgi:hypothetical protein
MYEVSELAVLLLRQRTLGRKVELGAVTQRVFLQPAFFVARTAPAPSRSYLPAAMMVAPTPKARLPSRV